MNIKIFHFISLSVIILSSCGIIGEGNKPIPARRLLISDGEYLVYNGYSGGEKNSVIFMATRLDKDGNLTLFIDSTNIGTSNEMKYKLPTSYSNYEEKINVSLARGSLIKSRDFWLDRMKLENQTGLAGREIDVVTNEDKAFIKEYKWDGNNLMKTESKVTLKKGYSYWDIDSFGLIGMRFLDINKPGVVYVINKFLKEAVPVSFKKYGTESLEVPAGKFTVDKYGFSTTDPFIGRLIGNRMDSFLVWIEKGSRGLIVKAKIPYIEIELRKVSNL